MISSGASVKCRDVTSWRFGNLFFRSARSVLVNRHVCGHSSAMSESVPGVGLAITPDTPPLRVDEQNVIRIGKTRVTLDTLVAAFQHGESPEEIARNYDALSL